MVGAGRLRAVRRRLPILAVVLPGVATRRTGFVLGCLDHEARDAGPGEVKGLRRRVRSSSHLRWRHPTCRARSTSPGPSRRCPRSPRPPAARQLDHGLEPRVQTGRRRLVDDLGGGHDRAGGGLDRAGVVADLEGVGVDCPRVEVGARGVSRGAAVLPAPRGRRQAPVQRLRGHAQSAQTRSSAQQSGRRSQSSSNFQPWPPVSGGSMEYSDHRTFEDHSRRCCPWEPRRRRRRLTCETVEDPTMTNPTTKAALDGRW